MPSSSEQHLVLEKGEKPRRALKHAALPGGTHARRPLLGGENPQSASQV